MIGYRLAELGQRGPDRTRPNQEKPKLPEENFQNRAPWG